MSCRIQLVGMIFPLQFILNRTIDPINKSHQKKGKKCSHACSECTTGSTPSTLKRTVCVPFHKVIGTGYTHNSIDNLLYDLRHRRRNHRFLSLEETTEHSQKGDDKYRRCQYTKWISHSGVIRINMRLDKSGTGKQKDAK